MSITLDMPDMLNQYQFLYTADQLLIDRSLKINSQLTPLVLFLEKEDLDFLMNCLNSNISYDDGCDAFFKCEIKSEALPPEQSPNNNKATSNIKLDALFYSLYMQSICVFFLDKNQVPFSRVSLLGMDLKTEIFPEQINLKLQTKELQGTYYESEK